MTGPIPVSTPAPDLKPLVELRNHAVVQLEAQRTKDIRDPFVRLRDFEEVIEAIDYVLKIAHEYDADVRPALCQEISALEFELRTTKIERDHAVAKVDTLRSALQRLSKSKNVTDPVKLEDLHALIEEQKKVIYDQNEMLDRMREACEAMAKDSALLRQSWEKIETEHEELSAALRQVVIEGDCTKCDCASYREDPNVCECGPHTAENCDAAAIIVRGMEIAGGSVK